MGSPPTIPYALFRAQSALEWQMILNFIIILVNLFLHIWCDLGEQHNGLQ